jgi:ADP-ribose pyrophosphatase YjhB (NUDIX family)
MPQERFKLVPSCYLILIRDGKTLLLRRQNTGYEDGNYGLVSGHLDGGESFRQAMVREAKEEAGITLNPKKLKVVHTLHRLQTGFSGERIDIFITAEDWEGEITNTEPHKCDDLSWFPLNQLPENTIPYIRQALECYQKNIFYSEHGF